jgi:hypothetical protein
MICGSRAQIKFSLLWCTWSQNPFAGCSMTLCTCYQKAIWTYLLGTLGTKGYWAFVLSSGLSSPSQRQMVFVPFVTCHLQKFVRYIWEEYVTFIKHPEY